MGLKRDSFEAAPNLVAQWMKSQLTAVSVAQQCLAMVSPVDVRDTKPYLVSQKCIVTRNLLLGWTLRPLLSELVLQGTFVKYLLVSSPKMLPCEMVTG